MTTLREPTHRRKRADFGTDAYPYKHQYARVLRLIEAGLCTHCGAVKPREGRRMCAECATRHRYANNLCRAKAMNRGKCGNCRTAPALPGLKRCRACTDRAEIRRRLDVAAEELRNPPPPKPPPLTPKERREKLLAEGKCQACAQPRGENGTRSYCRPCADKHTRGEMARQKRTVAEGRCQRCGVWRGLDGTAHHCRACADKQTARNLARYHERKECRP